ncbi:MAG: response regulator [Terriglobia bacterium]
MAKTLAVVDDLFFGAKIRASARQVGIELEMVRAADFSRAQLADGQPALMIVDLNATSANPVELIREVKSDPALAAIPVVGFVSHVQVALLRAAEQAGCEEVMPRSKFSATLPVLLRRYTTPGT